MMFQNKKQEKSLVLVPLGGLCNRFFAISSAIALCREYGWRLKVVWFKDWGMGADFHKLFRLSGDFSNVQVIDARLQDYRYDRPRKRNLWLTYPWQRMAFDFRFYFETAPDIEDYDTLIQRLKFPHYRSIYMTHCSPFYTAPDFLTALKPQTEMQSRINAHIRSLGIEDNTFGLHIRRTDMTVATEKSPLQLFITKIEEELKQDDSCHFYIASDSLEEKQRLKNLFGDKIITVMEPVRRDNENGIMHAMLDLYALAATKKIYGSFYSSFSKLAAQLENKELHILTI